MRVFLLPLIILIASSAFAQFTRYPVDPATFNRFSILQGDWVLEKGDTVITEAWVRKTDSLYTGVSYTIVKGDTVFTELMKLELRIKGIYFVPVGRLTKSGKQIDFQLFYFKRKAVFENYINDFPQIISYYQPVPGKLTAAIEGPVNNVNTVIEFPYVQRLKK